MKKQVKFNSTITIHYDPEDLTDDLKEYRKSDVLQRQMDFYLPEDPAENNFYLNVL